MDAKILATLLLVSVICAPTACPAFQFGDRSAASIGPSIVLVDENGYVVDLTQLSPNASYDDCVRYVIDKCNNKYMSVDSDACTSQYLMTCMERGEPN